MSNALSVVGLSLTAIGPFASAKGALITNATADELSGTYWDQNLCLRDSLISQSRWAAGGLSLVAVGTVFQIAALFA